MAELAASWRDAPPAGWSVLLDRDPNATPAHRPELGAALAATLSGLRAAFVAVEAAGELVGGCPVLIERRGALHWIHASYALLPGAPLALPGEHAAVDLAVAEAIASQARALAAVGGEWVLYRPLGPAVESRAWERIGGETKMSESAVLDLEGGFEGAWGRVPAHTRQAWSAAQRRGLRVAEEPGAVEEAYSLYRAQSRGWRGHPPVPLECVRRLLQPAGPAEPVARLFTARDAGGLLSAVLVLVHAREAMAWWSGSHPQGRARRAFPLLLLSVARWAADGGRARLNLGGSAGLESVAAFKRRLGARVHSFPVRWIGTDHAGALGRWVARLQASRRRSRRGGEAA